MREIVIWRGFFLFREEATTAEIAPPAEAQKNHFMSGGRATSFCGG
jgi:hypothetical protein